jgi:acyl carrier protein
MAAAPPRDGVEQSRWNFYFIQMNDRVELKTEIKRMMIENLMLKVGENEIGDDQPLFGPNSLGLDSVDALQLVVALDKNYGLKISDAQAARAILNSVNGIAAAIEGNPSAPK